MSELDKIEEISDGVREYLLLNYEIQKLEITKKASQIGASLFGLLISGISIFLFVLVLSMGLGFYFSSLIGNSFSGFLIMAGLYLIISLILFVGREKLLDKTMRDKIIRGLLDAENE